MFDDFHRQDGVEARPFSGKRLDRRDAVIRAGPCLLRMLTCDRDIAWGGIDAGDIRAHPRQRFAQQPRPAADIENGEPGERPRTRRRAPQGEMRDHQIAKPAKAKRVDLVKRPHRACGVPPIFTYRVETGDILGVDAGGGLHSLCPYIGRAGRWAVTRPARALYTPAFMTARPARAMRVEEGRWEPDGASGNEIRR